MSIPSKCRTYDVYFKPVEAALVSVEARTIKEARAKAEEVLDNMDKTELIERLLAAVGYAGLKIVDIYRAE